MPDRNDSQRSPEPDGVQKDTWKPGASGLAASCAADKAAKGRTDHIFHALLPGRSICSWCGCSSQMVRGCCSSQPRRRCGRFRSAPTFPKRSRRVLWSEWSRKPLNTSLPARWALCHSGPEPAGGPSDREELTVSRSSEYSDVLVGPLAVSLPASAALSAGPEQMQKYPAVSH